MSDSVEKLRLADRAEAILRKDRSALKQGAQRPPARTDNTTTSPKPA
jgi:hypothetical protein